MRDSLFVACERESCIVDKYGGRVGRNELCLPRLNVALMRSVETLQFSRRLETAEENCVDKRKD
jgi:hypothetical protein